VVAVKGMLAPKGLDLSTKGACKFVVTDAYVCCSIVMTLSEHARLLES